MHSCRSSQGICWSLESQEDLSSKVASRGDLSEVRTVIRKASKQIFGQSRQGNTSGNETQLGDRTTSPSAVLVHSSITKTSVWDKTASICWAGTIRFVSRSLGSFAPVIRPIRNCTRRTTTLRCERVSALKDEDEMQNFVIYWSREQS